MKTYKKLLYSAIVWLLFLVVISCRKDVEIPEIKVDPTFVPFTQSAPDLFPVGSINILSDYEIRNNRPFRGQIFTKVGSRMVGGTGLHIWEGLSFFGEILWDVIDYHKTERKFENVVDQLNEIEIGLDEIEKEIENNRILAQQEITSVLAFIQSEKLEEQCDIVDVAIGDSLPSGLLSMAKIVRTFQADSLNPENRSNMETLANSLPDMAYGRIYRSIGDGTMPDAIAQMYSILCPKQNVGVNAMRSFADLIIPYCQGHVNDETSAMNAYSLLEGYFMKVVIKQLQAAIVYSNFCNLNDPSGKAAKAFFEGYVTKIIPNEADKFLEIVDYLAINLMDYRTEKQFLNDMAYVQNGIAPDILFGKVYARSQFITNLLYAIAQKPYSVIGGHIVVPNKYTLDGSGKSVPDSISVKIGQEIVSSKGARQLSQIPYTYWKSTSQDQVCYPDHDWNSYRFATSTSSSVWPGSSQNVVIISNDTLKPWYHTVKTIKGSITSLYYNPFDPHKTSTTKNDSCFFQFGYFAASWYWGNLQLINNNKSIAAGTPKNVWPLQKFDVYHYDKTKKNEANLTPPMAVNYQKNNAFLYFYKFSYDYLSGKMTTSGTIGQWLARSDYFDINEPVCIVDSRTSFGVSASSVKPPVKNNISGLNTVEAWGCYSGYINGWSGKSKHLCISVGTNEHTASGYSYQLGDLVNDDFTDFESRYIFKPKFGKKQIETVNSYSPGFQYFYVTTNYVENVYGIISLDFSEQFIYTGLYELNRP